jgi:hypothetical protein
MKIICTIIRWVFGLTFCLASIGGFASGDTGLALFVLALGLLLLPPVTKALFNRKQPDINSQTLPPTTQSTSSRPQSFQSKIKGVQFPDRVDAIVWHINAIDNALKSNDLSLANLSYAKLIESIRQQNVNEKGNYDDALNTIRSEYDQFRQVYNLDYPPQFLPPSQRPKTNSTNTDKPKHTENLVNVSSKSTGNNSTEFTIELNEKELLKRVMDGTLGTGKRETTFEDVTGFYGTDQYSPNKLYCVSYCDGHYDNDKWKNGDIALVKGKTLLFKKKIQRPNDCYVSNDGIVICCDWQNSDALTGKFLVFDTTGEQIFSKKTTANLGACAVSDNSKIALFETHHSDTDDANKIFIVDIQQKQIIHKFQRPASFNNAFIDTDNKRIKLKDHKGFSFEIDFDGNQTNKAEYENQVMTKGSVYDRLWLYSDKADEVKLKDPSYLDLLDKALTDKDASYSFGKDKIYRMIGEYYEANGDIPKTIENWEKAMQINPKIGVKRKLDAWKKKV